MMSTSIQNHPRVTQLTLRPLEAEDWEAARCAWLAALADAPGAFQQTLDEAVSLPESYFRQRAVYSASGQTHRGFLAYCDEVPCGLVMAELANESADAWLHSLWVAQNVRRRGIARALVQAACGWAQGRGAKRVLLDVVKESEGAIALYRANGFEVLDAEQTTCGTRQAPALRMCKPLFG